MSMEYKLPLTAKEVEDKLVNQQHLYLHTLKNIYCYCTPGDSGEIYSLSFISHLNYPIMINSTTPYVEATLFSSLGNNFYIPCLGYGECRNSDIDNPGNEYAHYIGIKAQQGTLYVVTENFEDTSMIYLYNNSSVSSYLEDFYSITDLTTGQEIAL